MTEQPQCKLRCHRVTDHGICDRCTRLTAEDLEALTGLYGDVRDKLLEAQASTMGDRVSGSRERPLGFSVDALSLIGPVNTPGSMNIQDGDAHLQVGPPPILDTLASWARVVVEERILAELTLTVEALTEFLLTHHDWSRQQHWADEYAYDIRNAAHEARRLTGGYDPRPVMKVGVPCRRCDGLGLHELPGEDRVVCPCGLRLTLDEYHDWVRMYAAYAKNKGKTA